MDIIINLRKLTLANFKGIKSFSLDIENGGTTVRGDTATGKTSLVDAFLWLLFDKDSQGKKDFEIKTLDKDNNPIHNLCHEVEGKFEINGKKLTLTKCLTEKWTKKRGSSQAEFAGHNTGYHIDGVPMPKKEYDAKIRTLVDEDIFKLLTSPTYFNFLHWKKQREILLSVCGGISDNEVINSDSELEGLGKILDNHSIDDYRKIVNERKKAINKQLELIPARIDELHKSLANIDDIDVADVEVHIVNLETDIELINADDGTSKLKNKILTLKSELQRLEIERDDAIAGRDALQKRAIAEIQSDIDNNETAIDKLNSRIKDCISNQYENNKIIRHKKLSQIGLREDWNLLESRTPNVETHCPACSQGLPESDIANAVESFNKTKASSQQRINEQGKELADDIVKLEKSISDIDVEVENYSKAIRKESLILDDSFKKLASVKASEVMEITGDSNRMEEIERDIKKYAMEIVTQKPVDTSELRSKISNYRNQLAHAVAAVGTKDRIQELSDEEKKLAGEYGKLDTETFLMEKFIVAKVNLLEASINGMFKMAKFKLFKKNINGGIEETCEATYNGVPFSSGLNNGARVAVGLDIVSTLQKHYSIYAPIFIDNRESCTTLPEIACQVIGLVVDENYKTLIVEQN